MYFLSQKDRLLVTSKINVILFVRNNSLSTYQGNTPPRAVDAGARSAATACGNCVVLPFPLHSSQTAGFKCSC